jgi:uncharacterized membrane protein (UPF0127 family)
MAKLLDSQKKNVLLIDLQEAKTFWSRAIGLIGRHEISENFGMWFDHSNSIHTCFMRMPIDCVFLDREMRVKAVFENVKPWRLVWPVWSARSVIEMKSGRIRDLKIQVGDQLYVGH